MTSVALSDTKSEIGLIKFCRVLFISAVAFTPFASLQVDWIPSFIKMFLGYEDKLSMYPLFALSIIWFVWEAKRKRLKDYVPILLVFAAYFLINIAVVIHGDLIFPYYEFAHYETLEGGDRIAYQVISALFGSLSNQTSWIISNILKSCLTITTKFFFSWFLLYSAFLFYRETKFDVLNDIWIGITCILPFIFIYEIFEFSYLLGFSFGEVVLGKVNPLLYEINTSHGWWPPLYWSQVRSVFQEPSFFSYWGAFCLPSFMMNIQKRYKLALNLVEYFFIAFIVLSANARTGTALVIGAVAVFIVFNFIANMKKSVLTSIFVILVLSVAFIFATWFSVAINDPRNTDTSTATATVSNSGIASAITKYVDNNIESIVDPNARSNQQRFAMMRAQMEVFTDHPILGVSEQLSGFYFLDRFEQYEIENNEAKLWMETQIKNGSLMRGFPQLSEYTYSLATSGILGFIINTLPILFFVCLIVLRAVKNKFLCLQDVVVISFSAVVIAFGISNLFTVSYLVFFVILSQLLCLYGGCKNE